MSIEEIEKYHIEKLKSLGHKNDRIKQIVEQFHADGKYIFAIKISEHINKSQQKRIEELEKEKRTLEPFFNVKKENTELKERNKELENELKRFVSIQENGGDIGTETYSRFKQLLNQ